MTIQRTAAKPRTPDGRFIPNLCGDPNCYGLLQPDTMYGRPVWTCDGLTFDRADGPLRACERTYERRVDGEDGGRCDK